jgi:hypothetical protein
MSATATDGSASSTGSDGAVYTGFGDSSSESGSSSSEPSSSSSSDSAAARIVLNVGEIYGLAMIAAGVFTGFTFFL